MANKADCNLDETVEVTVKWGTVEKSSLAEPRGVLPEVPAEVAPASALTEKVRCAPWPRGVGSGFDWKPTTGPGVPSCLTQEEIAAVCHQGVVERNARGRGGLIADREVKGEAEGPGSEKNAPEAGRTEKIGKWDVAVERKRLVKKEAGGDVLYRKTWHSEVARCTRPGLKGFFCLSIW